MRPREEKKCRKGGISDEERGESLPESQGTGVYVFSCSRHVHLSSSGLQKKVDYQGVGTKKSEKPN